MAQATKEPCKKEACDIQACLTKNNFLPQKRRVYVAVSIYLIEIAFLLQKRKECYKLLRRY
ncbi:hypothetical protein CFP56_040379 [Quercus suber]|uniref:Uncharacterized protein n=1 Tax=Quercus suber TaxID=58331 RepID=A0AAW0IYY6_QUESU